MSFDQNWSYNTRLGATLGSFLKRERLLTHWGSQGRSGGGFRANPQSFERPFGDQFPVDFGIISWTKKRPDFRTGSVAFRAVQGELLGTKIGSFLKLIWRWIFELISSWFWARFERKREPIEAIILVVLATFASQAKTAESTVNSSRNEGRALEKMSGKLTKCVRKKGMERRMGKNLFCHGFTDHFKPLWDANGIPK